MIIQWLHKYILTKRQYDRSLKYNLRNYNIKINFTKFNCIYDLLIIKTENDLLLLNSSKSKNLIILLSPTLLIEKIENFPNQIENLIIIDFNELCILNNLPVNLKNLRMYSDWQMKYGFKLQKNYQKCKIPFGCEFLINDKPM